MKNFIFFTTEGFTTDSQSNEIDNSQILGTGKGDSLEDAFDNFRTNHSYLKEYSFKALGAIEYVGEFITDLEL